MSARHVSLPLIGALELTGCAGSVGAADRESSREGSSQQASTVNLHLAFEGTSISATLADNETSRDFVALLPITLTLNDYAATERIGDLPKRLSTHGAPAGITPAAGDLTYYAPWGNLAIFHKSFRYSKGLIKLGTIDSGLEVLRRPGPVRVTITLLDE